MNILIQIWFCYKIYWESLKVKIPFSLADKEESNSVVSDMRTQWAHSEGPKLLFYLCISWKIVFHPSCRRHIRVPGKAGRAPQGEPPQHHPSQPHNSQPSPSSHGVTPPACPRALLWHCPLRTCCTGLLCQWHVPKPRGSASPLLGSTGGKWAALGSGCRSFFPGKRDLQPAQHFIKNINTNPTDVPLFPGFPVRTLIFSIFPKRNVVKCWENAAEGNHPIDCHWTNTKQLREPSCTKSFMSNANCILFESESNIYQQ